MELFSIEFNGHYPVGAVALVQAEDAEQACELLQKELINMHLVQGNEIPRLLANCTQIVLTNEPTVTILLNGNY